MFTDLKYYLFKLTFYNINLIMGDGSQEDREQSMPYLF